MSRRDGTRDALTPCTASSRTPTPWPPGSAAPGPGLPVRGGGGEGRGHHRRRPGRLHRRPAAGLGPPVHPPRQAGPGLRGQARHRRGPRPARPPRPRSFPARGGPRPAEPAWGPPVDTAVACGAAADTPWCAWPARRPVGAGRPLRRFRALVRAELPGRWRPRVPGRGRIAALPAAAGPGGGRPAPGRRRGPRRGAPGPAGGGPRRRAPPWAPCGGRRTLAESALFALAETRHDAALPALQAALDAAVLLADTERALTALAVHRTAASQQVLLAVLADGSDAHARQALQALAPSASTGASPTGCGRPWRPARPDRARAALLRVVAEVFGG